MNLCLNAQKHEIPHTACGGFGITIDAKNDYLSVAEIQGASPKRRPYPPACHCCGSRSDSDPRCCPSPHPGKRDWSRTKDLADWLPTPRNNCHTSRCTTPIHSRSCRKALTRSAIYPLPHVCCFRYYHYTTPQHRHHYSPSICSPCFYSLHGRHTPTPLRWATEIFFRSRHSTVQ